jgi:hypothetical protein
MKRCILIGLLACLCLPVKAQPITLPKVDGKSEITEVVKLDSSFKIDDLYKNAKIYFVNIYSSGVANVIQYDDKASGTVIGKSSFQVQSNDNYKLGMLSVSVIWNVYYNTEIIVKNGRYKYRFYNFDVRELNPDSVYDRLFLERDLKDNGIEKAQQGAYKKTYLDIYHKMVAVCYAQAVILKKEMAKQQKLSDYNF